MNPPVNQSWMVVINLLMMATFLLGNGLAVVFLFVTAWRGKVRWSGPRCAGCGYDVRGQMKIDAKTGDKHVAGKCPECGRDLKDKKGLHFATGKFSWGLLGIAVLIVALTPSLPIGINYFQQYFSAKFKPLDQLNWSDVRVISNQRLCNYILLTIQTGSAYNGWQELESRLQNNELSREQMRAFTNQLTHAIENEKFISRQNTAGSCMKLILEKAYGGHEQSELLSRFCGGTPDFIQDNRLFNIERQSFRLKGIEDWHARPLGLEEELAIHEIRVNGKKINLYYSGVDEGVRLSRGQHGLYLRFTTLLPAGMHTLEIDYDRMLVEGDGSSSQIRKREDWPSSGLWEESGTLSLEVEVFDAATPTNAFIELVPHEGISKQLRKEMNVLFAQVRKKKGTRYLQLVLEGGNWWESQDGVDVMLGVKVKLQDKWLSMRKIASDLGWGYELEMDELLWQDWDGEQIDLIVYGDAEPRRDRHQTTKVWEGEIPFYDVKLRRLDRLSAK
ncbi:hypothetical protein [Poriferisphaera sp. WC338]|uniref:hypothetical protein n=1 Tax=Poriferisphaera sp. WC338 TaxID=3425129 RepID=UPI003D816792